MRVLLVSPFQPHPDADHGGGVYLGLLIRELARHAEVATVHYSHRGDPPAMTETRTFTTPRARTSEVSSATRWGQRLRFLWEWGVRGRPLEVAKIESTEFRQLLRRSVAEFRPDVIFVEFVVMAWCLAELEGSTTILTDHERGASVPRHFGPGNIGAWRDRRLWKRYVRHFYPMADLCQALTTEDATALREATGLPVEVRSPMIHIADTSLDPSTTDPVMLFFGDYAHHPNPESARALARDVLPLVHREIPDAELWLAGPRAGESVKELGELPGVRFLGFVDDLTDVLAKARCLAAPVYSGFGVRSKSMLAMAHGLPLVANRLGLQGMAPPAEAMALGETPEELAAACVKFLADKDAASRAGAVARRYIIDNLNGEKMALQQLDRARSLIR